MAKTTDEQLARRRAYARGYNSGRKGSWPEHRPPKPPDKVTGAIVEAARELRDAVDSKIATLMEDDPWTLELGPLVDQVDVAMKQLTASFAEVENG